jgi:hypothetical protein
MTDAECQMSGVDASSVITHPTSNISYQSGIPLLGLSVGFFLFC